MAVDATTREGWRSSLIAIRRQLDATQKQMASMLGISLSSYADIENGIRDCRRIHIYAAERVTLKQAVKHKDSGLLAEAMAKEFIALEPKS